VSNRSINGSANSENWTYDSLGRLSADANKLGTFNYAYVGVTNRLQTLTYPNGSTTNYTYFPNLQDKRLQEIRNQTSASALLSQFDYTYDTEGQIQTWTDGRRRGRVYNLTLQGLTGSGGREFRNLELRQSWALEHGCDTNWEPSTTAMSA
jgi:hypothetical protein